MPLYGDILRANFFDLKNSINHQINGDLEPLKLRPRPARPEVRRNFFWTAGSEAKNTRKVGMFKRLYRIHPPFLTP
jgi:hypothetical protein